MAYSNSFNTIINESIISIYNKYELEPEHASQVKKLSLLIFDKTKGQLHQMSDRERDLLAAGALLHDIGYYISAEGHNKNAYKLIMQEKPAGYTQEEIEIIANIARYHRGKKPNKKHDCYSGFSLQTKILVNKLAGMVRLADSLDRSHSNVIRDFDCVFDFFTGTLFIVLKLNTPDCSLEISKAAKKKDLFEETFGLQVQFRISQ